MSTWFVSHPSGGFKHTPTFFDALNVFAEKYGGVKLVFPHDTDEEVKETQALIAKADIVIAEVSMPSTGSGIELGWAYWADKPIIAFHQGGSDPSPALKFVTDEIHVYVTEEHVVEVLKVKR